MFTQKEAIASSVWEESTKDRHNILHAKIDQDVEQNPLSGPQHTLDRGGWVPATDRQLATESVWPTGSGSRRDMHDAGSTKQRLLSLLQQKQSGKL